MIRIQWSACVASLLWICIVPGTIADDSFICRRSRRTMPSSDTNRDYEKDIKRLEKRILYLENKLTDGLFNDGVITIGSSILPRDCTEIYNSGVTADGVYRISPDGGCPFDVFCDMENGGWTLIQRRIKGDVDFARGWDEYVNGFGDLRGDFWLGLEKMHRLTVHGSQIQIRLGNYGDVQSTDWAHYQAFTVDGVMSGYAMNIDPFNYEGTLKEMFSYHNGMKFSTYDRDNDQLGGHCSDIYGHSGWWFNACYRMGNLNGEFGKRGKGGISYFTNGVDVYVLTTVMKVMPMNGSC